MAFLKFEKLLIVSQVKAEEKAYRKINTSLGPGVYFWDRQVRAHRCLY